MFEEKNDSDTCCKGKEDLFFKTVGIPLGPSKCLFLFPGGERPRANLKDCLGGS